MNNDTPIQPVPVTIPANLTPFQFYCATTFPYIEADFDALTSYQLMCKIVNYLNQVIADVNLTNEGLNTINENVKNLYEAYNLFAQNITEKFNNISNEFNELKQSITAFENTVNQKLADMNATISGISEKTAEIENNLTTLSETVSNMASSIATQEATIRELKGTVDEHTTGLANQGAKLAQVERKADSNAENISNLQQTTSGLASSIATQEAAIRQIDEKTDSNTEKITTEVARLDKRIDNLGGGGGAAASYPDKYYTAFVYGFWLEENIESGIYEPSTSDTAGYTLPISAASGDSFTVKVSEKTAIRAVVYNLETVDVNTQPASIYNSSSNLIPDEYVDTFTFKIDVECTSVRIAFYDKIQNNPDIQIFKNNELLPFFYVNLNNFMDNIFYNREASPTYDVKGIPNVRYKDFIYNAGINSNGDIVKQEGYMVTSPINITNVKEISFKFNLYSNITMLTIEKNNTTIDVDSYYIGSGFTRVLSRPNNLANMKISMPIADLPVIKLTYDDNTVEILNFELSFESPVNLSAISGYIKLPGGSYDFKTIYLYNDVTIEGNNSIIKGTFYNDIYNPVDSNYRPRLTINNCVVSGDSSFKIYDLEMNHVILQEINNQMFTYRKVSQGCRLIFNYVSFFVASDYNTVASDDSIIYCDGNSTTYVNINNCNYMHNNNSNFGLIFSIGLLNLSINNSDFKFGTNYLINYTKSTGAQNPNIKVTNSKFRALLFGTTYKRHDIFSFSEADFFVFSRNDVGTLCTFRLDKCYGYIINNKIGYNSEYPFSGNVTYTKNINLFFNYISVVTVPEDFVYNTKLGEIETNTIL